MKTSNKFFAELIGTFVLVFGGCGTALFGHVGFLGVAIAFGLTKTEREQLVRERDSIQEILTRREGACVYGSPEIIKEFGAETQRLRNQLNEINTRLEEDDSKKK